jgi:xanthine dehydrogenase YagR molybdenum-binding subunit
MQFVTKSVHRVDGPDKVRGTAQYTYDVKAKEALIGRILSCPHPHARVLRIDTSEAERLPGVKAVLRAKNDGDLCRYAGEFVAAVAATSEDLATDAVRLIRVDYEELPFVVREEDARKPEAPRIRGGDSPNVDGGSPKTQGDVDAALADADVVVENTLRTQVQTHTCLEPHGLVCEWDEKGETLTAWASTQGVVGVRDNLAGAFELDRNSVRVICEHMGGGFGSKFGAGAEGPICARLARQAKQAVKLMLTRNQESMTSGNRPSSVQWIKAGAKRDGSIVAFDMRAYGTGGVGGGAGFPAPYIYRVPNYRIVQENVYVNAGAGKPMRAPGHPQASFGMEATMDDLADALGMDPIEFRIKNDPNERRHRQYRHAAQLVGWDRRNKTPGAGSGILRRGFGIGSATWGGGGGGTYAQVDILPDGAVTVRTATQDIGTATRTVVAMVAAEQLGLRVEDITPLIGDTSFPPSGGSGGSTTCASVAPAVKVTVDAALWALFQKVAPALGAEPENLAAVERTIRRKDDPSKSLTWSDACALLGTEAISQQAQHPGREGGLSSSGVAGCCAVEVEVNTETGRVRVVKAVSVQDCGLVVNKLTTESQIAGGVIQGISWALLEDRIMDRILGQQINPQMEFYKVAGAMDMPEIVPVAWAEQESLDRGVVGIGEPPVIPVAAAVGNAVKNAIGVRVTDMPITPRRVLAALHERGRA